MAEALISLAGITRALPSDDGVVVVLHGITLTINAGEMVAIIGASGSAKSTLMNILGCLDRATSGDCRIDGRPTGSLDRDELAEMRREHFGFIFQRHQWLAELSSFGNVEVPAIHSGAPAPSRLTRAGALLSRLGIGDRLHFRPGQLSGGQQRRVSIARAQMNDADAILAELNREGRTVILVTHDMSVANRANRIIEISDGLVVSNRPVTHPPGAPHAEDATDVLQHSSSAPTSTAVGTGWRAGLGRFDEAFKMAIVSMAAHRLRAFLTMLGIVIAIASVVAVVALGEGSREKVLANIASLGAKTLEIFPGQDFGDTRSGKVRTLLPSDAVELAHQPYVAGITPSVSLSKTIRSGRTEPSAQVNGVGADYFFVKGDEFAAGRAFDMDGLLHMTQQVVIDDNTRGAVP